MDESLPQGGDFFYYAISEYTKKVPTVHFLSPNIIINASRQELGNFFQLADAVRIMLYLEIER